MSGLADRVLRPSIMVFDDGLEEYIGEWDRSSKNRSMARDSKVSIVLAIRGEELGVERKYFPFVGIFAWECRGRVLGWPGSLREWIDVERGRT